MNSISMEYSEHLFFLLTQKINQVTNASSNDQVRAFSTMSLVDLLGEFSSVSVVRVALGYVLMVSGQFYRCVEIKFKISCFTLLKFK